MIEIEKTFLVKIFPSNLKQYKAIPILQGYISPLPTPLRIRKKGDKFELTKKIFLKPGDYSSAEEINIFLTEYEFNKLWPTVEKYLEKIRYLIPLENNLMAEMDVYQGKLKGLVVVEVEFKSEQEMNDFKAPEWFSKDITQEDFSANAFLAGKSFEEIKGYFEVKE